MFAFGRGDLGGIESEAFDFSQLEEYINDDSESNIYFHDALVTSSELAGASEKPHYAPRPKDLPPSTTGEDPAGRPSLGHASCASAPSEQQHKNSTFARGVDIGSSFAKPHHLPDSPPDSGSEPPFSPPNEDPKLRCPSIELLHHHNHMANMSHHPEEALKHPYLSFALPPKHHHAPDSSSSTSPTSSSSSPHHHHHPHHPSSVRHHSPVPVSPIPVHSTSMPVLATSAGQLIPQIQQTILSPYLGSNLPQHLIATAAPHVGHLYPGEEFLYDNLSSPVTSTTSGGKKRKLPESPKQQRGHHNGVLVKTEPSAPSPDPSTTTVLPSSEDDYSFDLSAADPNAALFVDSSYQCIRFQPFQQNTWSQLLDKDMKEIPSPQFRVDADKGFNFSNADESFVCQKKNHFQVTVHVQPTAEARFVRPAEGGGTRPVERFALHFHGVKMESPTQTIKVEQSQSDRSKKPFHPVPLEMVVDQVSKTTVGRLHFSETTSNNMRKKGKPNPDQRFFFLVVSLCAHVPGDGGPCTIIAHASEKIIVRASNPGQFENDMELSWQKGHTLDSIFHNGRVGINTDRPEEALVVHGNIKVTGHILQPSDFRAKYDIHELDTREQLRNVANLRIVRYRYLPEFGDRLGTTNLPDTGVIAQELQDVIPEAVVEAGDLVLQDGKLIEKLLVVNKERIFMENVGAVKELCKVTDNLETRIDELERINKKLSSMKRKDSLKSTSTDLSRVSSSTASSSGKRRCRHACSGKRRPGSSSSSSCSSQLIQSTIVILVVIMACCLLALATLYLMEYQSRNDMYFRGPLLIAVGSSSFRNTTSPMQENFSVMSTLFPSTTRSRPPTASFAKSTSTVADVTPKFNSRPSSQPPTVTSPDDPFSLDTDCLPDECPVYCCNPFHDDEDFMSISQEDSGQQHVDKKRSENLSKLDDLEELQKSNHSPKIESSKDQNHEIVLKARHKRKKRLTSSEEEPIDNNNVFASDEGTGPLLHLLELNVTLLPELCTKERMAEGSDAEQVSCSVHISRYFPHPNVTLHISNAEPDTIIQYCSSNHYTSCPGRLGDRKTHSGITKRNAIPEDRIWQLPVGAYFRSRHRFRIMSSIFSTDQRICSLAANSPFTEYIITFQRRCDK